MAKQSPTSRTTKWLKKHGFIRCVVERTIHRPRQPGQPYEPPFKRDAFGFGDILAAHPEHGIALIQVTSASHVSHRVRKITEDPKVAPLALNWLRAGAHIVVHGWGKRGPKDQKAWGLTQQRITIEDFGGEVVTKADVILTGKQAKKVVVDRTQGKLF